MKCFNHNDRDAVGTCKSCGKGVCRECAVDLGKGLACRAQCEKDVASMIALIDQNIQFSPVGRSMMVNARKNTYVQASFLLAAGVIFFLTGLGTDRVTELPGLLGMVFLIYGGYVLWRGKQLPRHRKEPHQASHMSSEPAPSAAASARDG